MKSKALLLQLAIASMSTLLTSKPLFAQSCKSLFSLGSSVTHINDLSFLRQYGELYDDVAKPLEYSRITLGSKAGFGLLASEFHLLMVAAANAASSAEELQIRRHIAKSIEPLTGPDYLTQFERIAINAYMGRLSVSVNKRLRAGSGDEIRAFLLTMDRALEKLPIYAGTLYRGVTDSDFRKQIELKKVGDTISDLGYVSTSIHYMPAKLYASKITDMSGKPDPMRGVIFIIKTTEGRDTQELALYSREKEVLFPRGTVFRIVGKEVNEEGFLVVQLTDSSSD